VAETGNSWASPASDGRLDAPAFHRNHVPIWSVLSRWIEDKPGNVLEVGSGTGQHVIEFARKSPHVLWWPSDCDERNIESIDAWRRHAHLQNVEAARRLDLCALEWGLNKADSATLSDLTAIFCANVLHISPWRTTLGLMWGASLRLHPGGRLFLYGRSSKMDATPPPATKLSMPRFAPATRNGACATSPIFGRSQRSTA